MTLSKKWSSTVGTDEKFAYFIEHENRSRSENDNGTAETFVSALPLSFSDLDLTADLF